MAELHMPVGADYFRELRENDSWYCDKTGFLARFLRNHAKVTLFTRPRRFGKTLAMDTMAEFLDIAKDGRDIFEGLDIMKDGTVCEHWMNQWPVISLTLKSVEGPDLDEAMRKMRDLLLFWRAEHRFLISSPAVDEDDRQFLQNLPGISGGERPLSSALRVFARAMAAHYGKPVVLLIDEYDVPVARAEMRGFYQPMMDFMRSFLGDALKSNPDLKFAVLTGCLRIVKESIFTGLNNFECFPISQPEHADAFGFTPAEVDALLTRTGLGSKIGELRDWYDGYRFGDGTEIYCPWDVVLYVKHHQSRPDTSPLNYWANSSGNDVVRKLIECTASAGAQDKIERLIAGGCIEEKLSDQMTYDSLYKDEGNLWSLLYQTGYLTQADRETMERCSCSGKNGRTCLVIPNREIRSIYIDAVESWFDDTLQAMDRTKMIEALWAGDAPFLSSLVSGILFSSISYHDAHEDFYHAFLAGLLSGTCRLSSNKEKGEGRPDIVLLSRDGTKACIIEVKHAISAADMEKSAHAALEQIHDRRYAEDLDSDPDILVCYGAAFFKKRCLFIAEMIRR